MEFYIIIFGLPLLIVFIDFLAFLIKGKRFVPIILLRITEIISFICIPFFYYSLDTKNNCCSDSTAFSPDHQLTILAIILLCLMAYFYSSYRSKIAAPVLEIVVNCLLVICIGLNIFIAIQTNAIVFALLGNAPIILFTILALAKNQKLFLEQSLEMRWGSNSKFEINAWKILNLDPILKYPVIFILCLPILLMLTVILLIVGQKPDSLIRAFTDTYKHGFSQWDYKCDNVDCGGHYLCSVAAKGHKKVVRPQRFGVRNDGLIICNRQLLISNAFEELIQEKMPFAHKGIRTQYNKVGACIHRYYTIFNIKFVSDFIYVIMKPLEWIFLLVLYTFDKKPENRIAQQYLLRNDRIQIEKLQKAKATCKITTKKCSVLLEKCIKEINGDTSYN